jgi:hypothetical protein
VRPRPAATAIGDEGPPLTAPRRAPQDLGLQEAVDTIAATQAQDAQEAKERRAEARKRKREEVGDAGEQRKSSRAKKEVNYAEESFFPKAMKVERVLAVPDALKMDLATAEELRKKASGQAASGRAGPAKKRGPVDSGKGVRLQVRCRGCPASARPLAVPLHAPDAPAAAPCPARALGRPRRDFGAIPNGKQVG